MSATNDTGYVNYFEVLGLDEAAKPGDVRRAYKKLMKDLVMEIAAVEITEERREKYLLEMAKLNAALFILRESELRDEYWRERSELIDLEHDWRKAADSGSESTNELRKAYDARIRNFLAKFVEEAMLAAGRDKECVEASHWDAAHERHASRILRHYRQSLYRRILERLPFAEVTPPAIDWEERRRFVADVLSERG
ncbi:MAG: hypothetical protein AMXMBFR4_28030 [Candidatus Hydrogenedentota bacterium]